MNKLQARTENANVGQSNVSSSELGDVNVIIGVNGSGKSGLLKSIRTQVLDSRKRYADLCCIGGDDSHNEIGMVIGAWIAMASERPSDFKTGVVLVKDIYPLVTDILGDEDGEHLYAVINGQQVSVEKMGAGFFSLISVVAAMFVGAGGFVLIDDFGTGLHLDTTCDVSNFITNRCEEDKTQVFIATHCPSALSSLQSAVGESRLDFRVINVKSIHELYHGGIDAAVVKW